MRKLGKAQAEMLGAMRAYAKKGVTKSHFLGKEWRIIDRLEELGLCDQRFVPGEGPTYFINEAGRSALPSPQSTSRGE